MSASLLALLQLCDTLFPVGSFAHSDGLESAVVDGWVRSSPDLEWWIRVQLSGFLATADGAALRIAMTALHLEDLVTIARVDDELLALRPSSAGREAIRAQGTRLLSTWQHSHPSDRLARAAAARKHHTHPVAFGMVCASAGLPVIEALEAFFYTRLAASVSAAMRLLPLGQHEAQLVLTRMLHDVPQHAARAAKSDEPPHGFTPAMDIAAMRHQYVHSRLFRS
jgi:urease accessory protein